MYSNIRGYISEKEKTERLKINEDEMEDDGTIKNVRHRVNRSVISERETSSLVFQCNGQRVLRLGTYFPKRVE